MYFPPGYLKAFPEGLFDQEEKLVLGYWGVRGSASELRLLLTYLGLDFEDKRYGLEGREAWFGTEKPKMAETNDFPNLPYLIDGS